MDWNALREQHKDEFDKWISEKYISRDELPQLIESETSGLKKNRDELKSEKVKLQEQMKNATTHAEKVKALAEVLRKHGLALDDSDEFDYTMIDEVLAQKKSAPDELQKKVQASTLEAQRRARELKAASEELEQVRLKHADAETYIQNLLVQKELQRQLLESGYTAPVVETIIPSLSLQSGAAVERDAETGERRAVTKDGKNLAEFVSAWKASDAGKALLTAPVNRGGNASTTRNTTSKTMTRSAFNSLSHGDRAAVMKDGTTVTD